MARFGAEPGERGSSEIRTTSDGITQVCFVPLSTPESGSPAASRLADGVKLLEISPSSGRLAIYPTDTRHWSDDFLGPKYSTIEKITLPVDLDYEYWDVHDVLENLPSGFTKDLEYGLGLAHEHDWLVRLIEEHTACIEMRFVDGGQTPAVDGETFTLGLAWFGALVAELRRIKSRGDHASLRVRRAYGHNQLAEYLRVEPVRYAYGRHVDSRFIAGAALDREEVTEEVVASLAEAVSSRVTEAARVAPARMVALQREVELANLDHLIEAYRVALDARHPEQWWQTFFEENIFALQLLFGGPTIFVDAQVAIGSGDNRPKGKKIADYLFQNSMTNNAALVEIKRPSTKLLKRRPYRARVYGVQSEISEALTQVLDQARELTRNELATKSRTGRTSWVTSSPRCFVVAGRASELDTHDKKKSFDLYREHLAGVQLVTYDEILEQLKNLRDFLAADRRAGSPAIS
ncbi:Shedu immune nuclease family protein [Cellulomonas xiejunii]|uniref:DUF4263 domain-containing protein n=1 Tax=Cellulomonas xiejunii TaxID=2968083 RepID=A0ABY5KQV8_9CELL|nr:Shedu immune nuclease family protein [Cellulomonas xiejunii]MCC2321259.1 DUF4263 domain-containing protein [Cellulomonas xiejunii]UUI71846.1 DUF4263 domain-containing protein [Cellulomonas xiejunii]